MERIERIILKNLIENKEYGNRIIPHLTSKFLDDSNIHGRKIIDAIVKYKNDYKGIPNYETLYMELNKDRSASEGTHEALKGIQDEYIEPLKLDYLVDATENHYQINEASRVIYKCAEILDGKETKTPKEAIPEMLKEALRKSFDNSVGMLYASDRFIDEQYEHYHSPARIFPFPDWPSMSKAFKGGMRKKRIAIFMSSTSVGKCLQEKTKIKIKNKKSGEIKEIEIGEFYKFMKNKI